MFKVYNSINKIASGLLDFFDNSGIKLSKHNKKVLPYIITSMIEGESVVTADLTSYLPTSLFSSNDDSNQKRLWRFFNKNKIDTNKVYTLFIKNVIKKMHLKHDKIVIVLDHMFTKNNFVTLMFTLKVGKQGIPIWFKSEKTKSFAHSEIYEHTKKKLFSEDFIFNAIKDVHNLFKDYTDSKIIFLGDRWFCNLKLMRYINSLDDYYCIRAKANSNIKFKIYDKKEGHVMTKRLSDIKPKKNIAKYFKDLPFGSFEYHTNLAIARGKLSDDPWYVLTNMEPNEALRQYAHRFGAIENVFKSQKSNGLNLEKTKTKNLHAFETLYFIVCICTTWLTILGADYVRNSNHYSKYIKFRHTKKNGNKPPTSITSYFRLGLSIFHKTFNKKVPFTLKTTFVLYL